MKIQGFFSSGLISHRVWGVLEARRAFQFLLTDQEFSYPIDS
jgi:hypothetical protein